MHKLSNLRFIWMQPQTLAAINIADMVAHPPLSMYVKAPAVDEGLYYARSVSIPPDVASVKEMVIPATHGVLPATEIPSQ